jgi:hypothetical protein
MLKLATIVTVLASIALSASAHAEEKAPRAKRPVVCSEWKVLRGPERVVALCTDGKREQILTRWAEVSIPLSRSEDEVGGKVRRVIVGWR